MNQKLQNILEIIQQSEKMDAEQKDNLIKAVKDADKELEITAFKLERTEKVKKTTAILLEETIEELEQKRKAVEEQNRDLEIEAALERTRVVALSMKEPADMLEICRIISEQLELLGIKDIRNVQTAIVYEEKKTYLNYEYYRLHDKALITEVQYNIHPAQAEFASQMLKGPDSFFSTSFKGTELEEWIESQKKSPQFVDSYLEKADSVNYYFYSLGPVALGISAYCPLPENDLQIFKRFRHVFNLSYKRYTDISLAEARAKEARIEAAMEKIRNRTLLMKNSSELNDAVATFFQQFKFLELLPGEARTYFSHVNTAADTAEVWMTHANGQVMSGSHITPLTKSSELKKLYLEWKKNKEIISSRVYKGKSLIDYIKFLTTLPHVAKDRDYKKLFRNLPDQIVMTDAGFLHGFLGIMTYKPLSPEALHLLERFAKVFEFTYTRFLDLQKAEVQAREAKIEASLERVRAKTMAMHQSNELAETAAVLFKQLIHLGIEPNRIYIGIIKDEKRNCEFWITDEDGSKVSTAFAANLNDNNSFQKMFSGWAAQKTSLVIDMRGKELQEYFRHLNKLGVPFKEGLTQKRRMQYIAYFSKGFIGVASPDETKPETLQLLERFAAVFNLTYTRFNDLQQAEAQNKIIQAENERKSSELEEARQLQLAMLPKEVPQLPHLDIAVHMKTATEVGGDYYDFSTKEDRTLNICLGDATGHGMKAGIMVSSMKSIFTTNATKMNLENFFATANSGIKSMNLKRMMMGFTMFNFNSQNFRMVNAGMPPVYLYRKKSNTIEELRGHGLPIGAMSKSRYTVLESTLEKDDILLLFTDGMPELQNVKKEQYGYKSLQRQFKQVVMRKPQEIVNQLKKAAAQWSEGRDPEDDITFVVIKMK